MGPKDVVRDGCYGYVGIVVERARPDERWIRRQQHPAVAALPATAWWRVLPLGGGAAILAEAFLERLRAASYDDFLAAVDHANEHGRRALAALFPDFVRRALDGGRQS